MRLTVLVPGLLRSYTGGAAEVAVEVSAAADNPGPTLADAVAALDRAYPGLAFRIVDEQRRIRPHVRLFVDRHEARELAAPLPAAATLMIVGALSGG